MRVIITEKSMPVLIIFFVRLPFAVWENWSKI
jgi:hypothetical protein